LQAGKADTLFLSDDILKVELRSDFTAIQKDRSEEPVYHEGELIYRTGNGDHVKLSVRVMVRGNFRRDPKHCEFPPLYVNFRKSEVKNTIFDNQNRIKLVTHCQSREDLIEEYMVYKMYNQVTKRSMKARMARIIYYDTKADSVLFTNYSFFIEDKDKVAERNNSKETLKFMTPFSLDKESYMKLTFFQYMIGNRDWYVSSRKNIDLMQPDDTSQAPYAIPYDFDFCGMIDADYTKPQGVPKEKLSERRIYKGICYSEGELNEVFDFYRRLRPAFVSIIKSQKYLSAYTRRQDIRYIGYFYKVIGDKNLLSKEFLERCETRKDYNIPE